MNKKLWDMIEQAAKETNNDPNGEYNLDLMTRFAELIRQDEKEKCAKLCDDWRGHVAANLAAAIRGRTE
jgi:hypothetical protein